MRLAALCPPVWLAAFLIGSRTGWLPAIVGASALLTVLALAVDGRAIVRLFRPSARGAWMGLAAAVASVAIPYLGFRVLGAQLVGATGELYRHFPNRDWPYAFVIAAVVVAEEIIWRGFVQSALRGRVILSALVYALAHVTSGSWLLVALALAFGGFWSWLRKVSDGLFAPLLSHLAFDLTFLFFLPLGQ